VPFLALQWLFVVVGVIVVAAAGGVGVLAGAAVVVVCAGTAVVLVCAGTAVVLVCAARAVVLVHAVGAVVLVGAVQAVVLVGAVGGAVDAVTSALKYLTQMCHSSCNSHIIIVPHYMIKQLFQMKYFIRYLVKQT